MHPYTSYLREHLDEDERFEVICALWQLAIADDRIDKFEEHTIRKAADLHFYLSHNRFIEAKLRAKSARPPYFGNVSPFYCLLLALFLF